MPMSPRLLRPRASGATHPEALHWATRVTTNGGTVSSNTLAAVSTFCASIDSASGLRAAILRLNLFCGDQLAAALVPLYRSASFGGAVIGSATDTNVNFVEGDFSATGLKGNGTTKYLNTGLAPSDLSSVFSSHIALSATSLETTASSGGAVLYAGSDNSANGQSVMDIGVYNYTPFSNVRGLRFNTGTNYPVVSSGAAGAAESLMVATSRSSVDLAGYSGGAVGGTSTATRVSGTNTRPIFVFCTNNVGTAAAFSAMRARLYSIGNGLTASQVTAYTNAVSALNTALSRT